MYANLLYIMFQIHFIFQQFDDRNQQIGIAQPTEYIFKYAQVFMLHPFTYSIRKWGKNNQRYGRIFLFYMTPDIESVTIVCPGHTYNQVEHCIVELYPCIFFSRDLCKPRRVTQTQIHVLVKYLFINTPIVFQHKSIIRICNQKHIENTFRHQINELGILKIKLIQF